MNWIRFSDLGEDPRSAMQGQRWLVMSAHDLPHATAALAFSELEDVLVAVDHRGVQVEHGLWMRAVHLMVVSDTSHAAGPSGQQRHHASLGQRCSCRNSPLVVGLEGLEPSINSV